MTRTPDPSRSATDRLAAAGVVVFGVGLVWLVGVLVAWGAGADLPGLVVAVPWLLIPPGFALGLAGLVLSAVTRRRGGRSGSP